MSRTRSLLHVAPVLVVCGLCFLASHGVSQAPAKLASKPAAAAQSQGAQTNAVHGDDDEPQRIFAQNCSRCHNAPEGFSPRVAGTVVRHMRVRASLSQHEEEQLLKFFNP